MTVAIFYYYYTSAPVIIARDKAKIIGKPLFANK